MRALIASSLPSLPGTLVQLFAHSRRGLVAPSSMPRIERNTLNATINPRWLAKYRQSVGLCEDAAAPLPPLVLQIAVAPLHLAIIADARFPFRALGLVHMSQHITQTRPIRNDALLDISTYTADARWEKRGMSFGLVTEARESGRLVWRGETRALARMHTPLQQPEKGLAKAKNKKHAEVTKLPDRHLASLTVPESTGRHYAAIAGDRNPIHQHALLARPFGFRRAIVHGTWTLARALSQAGLPASGTYTLDAQFKRPVELPSTIEILAAHDAARRRDRLVVADSAGQVHLDIALTMPSAARASRAARHK